MICDADARHARADDGDVDNGWELWCGSVCVQGTGFRAPEGGGGCWMGEGLVRRDGVFGWHGSLVSGSMLMSFVFGSDVDVFLIQVFKLPIEKQQRHLSK